ncbi:hypothetical protein QGN23_13965 [Chryseobacterium gotjawalense]|uniref:Uncharacterized protein n=1 Tax=Chryseobacterium gotjawalense TaxID=3042315 RepID=A0ABY8REA5_9FLAO|nr:hypothetical protein [Chryseobacterium sp. wdc7]WHF51513.1 hypothetical protein QGN23_13965 [Chryseobacterium sp. wdc7]
MPSSEKQSTTFTGRRKHTGFSCRYLNNRQNLYHDQFRKRNRWVFSLMLRFEMTELSEYNGKMATADLAKQQVSI